MHTSRESVFISRRPGRDSRVQELGLIPSSLRVTNILSSFYMCDSKKLQLLQLPRGVPFVALPRFFLPKKRVSSVSHPISAGRGVEHRDRAVVRGPLALADVTSQHHRATGQDLSGSLLLLSSNPEQHQQHPGNPNCPALPVPAASAMHHRDLPPAIRSCCALAPMTPPVSSSSALGARWTHRHADGRVCGP